MSNPIDKKRRTREEMYKKKPFFIDNIVLDFWSSGLKFPHL